MSWMKIVSWHRIAKVTAAGWHTRCGRLITTEDAAVSDALPLSEPSCETCARLTLHDEEPRR